MRALFAFSKKEAIEMLRTHKLLIMACVFIILGVMNPVTAKFAPDLIAELAPAGMKIELPEPAAMDSWEQFFKNVSQMGLVVAVIVLSGMMSGELSCGTLINMLTKGLSRHTVVLSKTIMAVVLWTASYILCFAVSYAYTSYFWPGDSVSNLFFAVFCLWLFGMLLLSCIILGGIIFGRSYGSILFTAGIVVLFALLGIFPVIDEINPVGLVSKNVQLLKGRFAPAELYGPAVSTVLLFAAFTILSVALFNKKQM